MATHGEQPIFTEMQGMALKAIYRNDLNALREIITLENKTSEERKGITSLLVRKQVLLHVEGEDRMEWRAFKALYRFCPEEVSQGVVTKATMLQDYMTAYRGLIMHVAAVLDRDEIISKVLDMADSLENRNGLPRMLVTRDSQGRTILGVAIDENHSRSIGIILSWLFEKRNCLAVYNKGLVTDVVLDALPRNTSKICMKLPPYIIVANVIHKTQFYITQRIVPLTWPIIFSNFSLLQRLVKERKSFGEQNDPSLLHMAVYLYATELMAPARKDILKYLIEGADLSPTENRPRLDDICSVRSNGHILINGTAVHFALGHADVNQVFEFHPGFETEPHRFSTKESTKSLRKTFCSFQNALSFTGNQSVIEMVAFLRDQGADLFKPNDAGKSPLACLPPDADPQLLCQFVDIIDLQ